MAEDYRISYADLSIINRALSTIDTQMTYVNGELNVISNKQVKLEDDILQLYKSLYDFIEEDRRQKNLQLAETRLGNIRQDIQINFGYYSEIRRMSIGILQGVENQLVSDETLKFATEETMIKSPGYWLAPVLVGMASWIRNDKVTCEKAINESLRRDDYKTTMFFMLLMRRLERKDASLKWLTRYFDHQTPNELDREFILVLEGIISGIFTPGARTLLMQNVKQWLDQLTEGDAFVNKQKDKWIEFYSANSTSLKKDKYPLLQEYAENWRELESALESAMSHSVINSYFKSIIDSNGISNNSLKNDLDGILSRLVTNFDDEELPLRKKERLNALIIERDGDKDLAEKMMKAEEEIYEEKVDFLQLLTNAAFNPESSGSTKGTQVLAVSISQPWIVESYNTYTANLRKDLPTSINLMIDGFKTSTIDGSDEVEQLKKQVEYYNNLFENALNSIPSPMLKYILGGLIAAGGIALTTTSVVLGIIVALIGVIIIIMSFTSNQKKKEEIQSDFTTRHKNGKEILRGCLAESVDYTTELRKEDQNAEKVIELIKSINPEDFSGYSKDISRTII